MKITIEFDENVLTKQMASNIVLNALNDKGLIDKIKPGKNLKFELEKGSAVVTQSGVRLGFLITRYSND